jgi:hypothetical protein
MRPAGKYRNYKTNVRNPNRVLIEQFKRAYWLCLCHHGLRITTTFQTYFAEGSERVVSQDIYSLARWLANMLNADIRHRSYPMIRLQVVDLLLENKNPQIFAKKLDDVQRICESRLVLRKSEVHLLAVIR